jgi:HSP20 family protein
MSRLFEESFVGPRFEFFVGRTFPLDIYETEDKLSYVIETALPGYKPEEVQITAEGDMLTIRVMKKGEEKVEKAAYVRRERYEGEMVRTVTLPGIEATKVEATSDFR